jgi:hypothetical protein
MPSAELPFHMNAFCIPSLERESIREVAMLHVREWFLVFGVVELDFV